MTNGSFSSKLTEALLRTQREGTAPEQPAASSNGTAPGPTDGNSTSVPPPSSPPPPPPRPVYEPETDIERLVLDFRAAPEKYVRLLDQHAPLPAGVGTLLEKVAERVKGLSVEDAAVPGTSRNDPLIDATIFFVAKVLMGPGADHYRVLGLNSDALVEDVHNHYRWLRRIFAVTEQNDRGQTVVMRISEAYVMLRDVERRRDYDRHKLGRSGHLHMKDATSQSFSPSFVDLPSSRNTVRNARQKKRTKPSLIIAVGMVVVAVVILLNREPPPPPSDPDDALVNSAPPVSSPEPVSDTLGTDARVPPAKPDAAQTDSQVTLNTPPAESNEAEGTGRPATSASDAALLQEVEKFAGGAAAPQPAATPPITINQPANENTAASVGESPAVATAPAAAVPAVPPAPDAQAVARQQEVQRLLAYGKLLVDEMQLTQPAGRNAYEVYQQVLALDPQNEGAHQGMLSIVQRYIGIVRGRMQTKRYDEAVELADKGLAIQPSNEQLRVLRALAAEKASQVLVPATALSPEGAAAAQRDVGDPGPAARDQAVPPSASVSAPSADSTAPQPPQSQPQPSSNQVASVPPELDRAATPPLGNETPSAAPTPSGGGLAIIPVLPSPGEAPAAPSSSSSSAPPEMPIATPGAQGSALGISEAALQTFINEFVRAYERGELEPFMALFAEGARTNNQVSKSGIRDDYEKLFESTTSRLMRVRDVRWSFDASSAIGEGDYSLTVLKKNESRPRSYEGSLTFQLVKRDGQLQIKGLYHSQRKITQ